MLYKKNKTKNISFPLGGIGSGCIGLAGNGALIDWEIFNRPNKNSYNGYSHFAIKVKQGGKAVTRVLQGDTCESFMGMSERNNDHVGFGYGAHTCSLAGYPHFKNVSFDGSFPIAKLGFSDADFPAKVRLTAFNPLIPHDEYNSSLPAAFFEWQVENPTGEDMECAICLSLQNPAECSVNETVCGSGAKGIFFKDNGHGKEEIGYTDLCVLTDGADSEAQAYWYRGAWQDAPTTFWKNFSAEGGLPERNYKDAGKKDHGSVAAYFKVAAGSAQKVRFVLAWNVPNQYNYWFPIKDQDGKDLQWKNYYATQFESSYETAEYALGKFGELLEKTEGFTYGIEKSTLTKYMKDAISANLSVLKSPTVLRMEDGSLWAWEGCKEKEGSCEGSCQHVWNYAYALPFLFPRLERSLRENTFKYALYENGATEFRIPLPLGRKPDPFRPCVDGQMGEIIKCYREWKLSGESEWIKSNADKIFSMLEFAWSEENRDRWDRNQDGIIEGRQHHTLDMELFGANSWLEGFYLLALDCAARIAEEVGDCERAEKYRTLYENGRRYTNEELFNGEYFHQKIDLKDKTVTDAFGADNYWNEESEEIKYQVAEGCIIDQMLADWHGAIIGEREIFDRDKKGRALESLYKYNFKPTMREVTNMWRNFALNDESGTVICSYPDSAKLPAIPISYCEECMTGFEYALAGLMLANGYIDEGCAMVKAVRDRYDGERRNPWNEIECGSNYARSMASFALMPICSGFSFDMREKYIGFSPILSDTGSFLFSVGNSWGTVRITKKSHKLSLLGDALTLASYGLKDADRVRSVKVDGVEIPFKIDSGRIFFDEITAKKEFDIKLK